MTENPILSGLNKAQIKAVTHTEGPLLVVAGPGTGKTHTIVRRIAYLLDIGVKPHEILAITFTNRAAREMRERTEAFTGQKGIGISIVTFHMFGLNMLRHITGREFTLIGRDEQVEILKDLTGGRVKDGLDALDKISKIKNLFDEKGMENNSIYQRYQAILRDMNALDLDDLILLPVELLTRDEKAWSYGEMFRYIMIDEYQDINPSQYRLIKALSRFTWNICAVGDSDQAIYAFRGADVENFLNFERDFHGAEVVVLDENYRSSGIILEASQNLIKNNTKRIKKDIHAIREIENIPIKLISTYDERAEAEAIVREIENRIGAISHFHIMQAKQSYDYGEGSYRFSDFAILYRTNSQSRKLKEAFVEAGIPFKVIGDTDSRVLKQIEERLKNRLNDISHGSTLESILEEAFSSVEDDELTGLKRNLIFAYRDLPVVEGLSRVIDELSLFTSPDAFDPEADAVHLMTLHMSKGLEFKVVFIAGVEDGIIPYRLSQRDGDDEEERRLFYVGMTRARDELCLCYCENRSDHGKGTGQRPSPFIKEIPEAYIKHMVLSRREKAKKKPRQQRLF
ncbi:MAG: ATP-dependent helicase [Syntrophorhabdaceae bacterium]|nr:ATP-dependent helicase [Syntrophorhabdaceae bacterium]